jgi:hypothetical protein
MQNGVANNLAALGAVFSRCRPIAFNSAPNEIQFNIWRRKRLFGIIPYNSFAGHIRFCDFGDCWRVMQIDADRTNGPFLGADFRKNDGARLDAWKWTVDCDRWLPVWVEAEEREIFERIEESIRIAAQCLPTTLS